LFCPITSQAKGYPFEVSLPSGLAISGVVLADHVKCLDWRARQAEFAGEVPESVVAEVVRRLGLLLGTFPPLEDGPAEQESVTSP
jgi:mRNA interferase MazF